MRIKSITIHSFGSIIDQTVDFSEIPLSTVEAINHDTGGASGAGKSMFFKAIEYGLCVLSSPAKQFENRQTGSKPHVSLELEKEGDIYIVERKLKASNELKITKNGEVLVHGGKEAETFLFDQVLKIPKDFFARILHKRQGERSFFVNLTPKQSFELLTDILGLDRYEELMAKLKARDSELSILIEKDAEDLEEQKKEKEQYESNISRYASIVESHKKDIATLKQSLEKTKQQIVELTAKRDDLANKIKEQTKSSVPDDLDRTIKVLGNVLTSLEQEMLEKDHEKEIALGQMSEISKKINTLSLTISKEISEAEHQKKSEILLGQSKIERTKKDIASLRESLSHLTESKCPVCLRQWSGDDFDKKVSDITAEIDSKEKEIEAISDAIKQKVAAADLKIEDIKKKESVLQELKQQESDIKKHIDGIGALVSNLKKSIAEKQAEFQASKQKALDIAKEKIAGLTSEMSALNNDIKQLEAVRSSQEAELSKKSQDLSSASAILEQDKTRYERVSLSLLENQSRLDAYAAERAVANRLFQYIKAYTSILFQDFLDSVFDEANHILNSVPNASHITLGYDISKELKNGKTKDGELVIRYNSGEYTDVSFDSFSGGEQTSIGLAIDLAFVKALSSAISSSSIPSIWILDEPFDGLDPISKMAFLDIIRSAGREALVVDHDKTVKDMAESVLLVEKKDGTSSIKWLT